MCSPSIANAKNECFKCFRPPRKSNGNSFWSHLRRLCPHISCMRQSYPILRIFRYWATVAKWNNSYLTKWNRPFVNADNSKPLHQTNKQTINFVAQDFGGQNSKQKKKKISFRKHQRSRVHFILFFLSLAHGTTNWTKTRKNPILFIAAQIWLPSAIITRKMKTKSRILISDQPNRVVCFFFSIDFKMLSDFERATIKIMAFSLHRALYKIKRDLIVALAISDGGDWRLTARIEPIHFFLFLGKIANWPEHW